MSAVHQKASFIIAYNRTMKFEGGYVKTHHHRGGEIYKGITRRYHSKWAGWEIIDNYKKRKDFPRILSSDQKLELMVQELYKEYYWHKMRGEEILNQETANHLFNYCVTRGISRGIKTFQRSLGISQTGKVDNATLNAINSRGH